MEHIQLVIENYHKDKVGLGNILKCFMSSLSINEDTRIVCHPEYMYGTYDTILDPSFIYTGKTKKSCENVYTCRLLLLRREEEHQENIPSDETYFGGLSNPRFNWYWSFTKQIDWNYDPTKVHPIVRDRIFEAMGRLIFLPIIHSEVNQFLATVPHPFLAVSVRTWKASHEHNIRRAYDSDCYINKINEVEKKYNMKTIVLSIDNEEFIEPYLRVPNVFVIRKPDHFNALQFALYKMLVLSRSSHFIGNRISTFTECVFWFSRHTTRVHTVF
jgi:hypothetical protein